MGPGYTEDFAIPDEVEEMRREESEGFSQWKD